jgi:hypothetical protein
LRYSAQGTRIDITATINTQHMLPITASRCASRASARDEADMIEAALEGLLQQDYPAVFHAMLVDHHSTDWCRVCAAPSYAGPSCFANA